MSKPRLLNPYLYTFSIFTLWKSIVYYRLCRDRIFFDKILISEYKLFKRSNKANLFLSPGPVACFSDKNDVFNIWLRTGKCLRKVEHIRGHLQHSYSITVNQVMVATKIFEVMTYTPNLMTVGNSVLKFTFRKHFPVLNHILSIIIIYYVSYHRVCN
jgi:hypothetical protein